MQINLIEKATQQPLIIETQHNDPDKRVELNYIGEKNTIFSFVREVKQGKHGHYGHIFQLDSTTNLDLQSVVYDLEGFEVLSLTPPIKANPLPDGAVS